MIWFKTYDGLWILWMPSAGLVVVGLLRIAPCRSLGNGSGPLARLSLQHISSHVPDFTPEL